MIKRTPDQWRALFAAHDESDLTAAAFCREQGLCPKYFSVRRRQLNAGSVPTSKPKASQPAFTPVSMPVIPNSPMIEIRLSDGVQLHVPLAVSPQWLGTLLQQLQA